MSSKVCEVCDTCLARSAVLRSSESALARTSGQAEPKICVAAADILQQRYTTAETTAQRNLRCSCRYCTAEIYYSTDHSAEKSALQLQIFYSRDILQQRLQRREICVPAAADILQQMYVTAERYTVVYWLSLICILHQIC